MLLVTLQAYEFPLFRATPHARLRTFDALFGAGQKMFSGALITLGCRGAILAGLFARLTFVVPSVLICHAGYTLLGSVEYVIGGTTGALIERRAGFAGREALDALFGLGVEEGA